MCVCKTLCYSLDRSQTERLCFNIPLFHLTFSDVVHVQMEGRQMMFYGKEDKDFVLRHFFHEN